MQSKHWLVLKKCAQNAEHKKIESCLVWFRFGGRKRVGKIVLNCTNTRFNSTQNVRSDLLLQHVIRIWSVIVVKQFATCGFVNQRFIFTQPLWSAIRWYFVGASIEYSYTVLCMCCVLRTCARVLFPFFPSVRSFVFLSFLVRFEFNWSLQPVWNSEWQFNVSTRTVKITFV